VEEAGDGFPMEQWCQSEMIYPINTQTELATSLAYFADHLNGSLLFDHLGTGVLQNECLDMQIVCAPGKPPHQDYRYGWGASLSIATDWVIAEIARFLHADKVNTCIIEDPCGEPSDPGLTSGAAGPVWFYQNHVLWPITRSMAKPPVIRKSLEWGLAGKPHIIGFFQSPGYAQEVSSGPIISNELLIEITDSMRRLVTDVFDGEGYLVWNRNT
jgi:hypothetical protein